jgi:leader peptidase (prepilin peptidase)/N-methyltransferase
MDAAVAAVGGAILGVPVGAFLNVVIDRVPDRASLHGPREGDPAVPVSWLGLPAQPWLLRRGRGSLPRAWLAVELVTAALFALFAGRYHHSAYLPALLVLCATLVAVSVVDLRLLRIPDRITFPAIALALPLLLVGALQDVEIGPFTSALVGAVLYFVVLLVPHLVYPRGMGFGDVKLALLMGLYLGAAGWSDLYPVLGPLRFVLYALILGCALGVVFGVGVRIATRRRGEFPFGPALAAACLVVLYFASDLRL